MGYFDVAGLKLFKITCRYQNNASPIEIENVFCVSRKAQKKFFIPFFECIDVQESCVVRFIEELSKTFCPNKF